MSSSDLKSPLKIPVIDANCFLSGEELSRSELLELLAFSEVVREKRNLSELRSRLQGKSLALLFEKPSLRTRFSFTVAMYELGGLAIDCLSTSTKKEEPEDTVKVLAGYCQGVMLRTHEHTALERMAAKNAIPVINGLSDSHHPCQALADLLTLCQTFGKLEGLKLAYIGDGNNVLHSLLLLGPFLGMQISYACPEGFEPNAFIVKRARARAKKGGGSIETHLTALEAVKGVDAVYTDVWTSMGFESQAQDRESAFEGFQVNEELFSQASPRAIAMHCLPMVRGKEITDGVADHPRSALFRQSENRLHAQKALLCALLGKGT